VFGARGARTEAVRDLVGEFDVDGRTVEQRGLLRGEIGRPRVAVGGVRAHRSGIVGGRVDIETGTLRGIASAGE
jgi:hypothetical protein